MLTLCPAAPTVKPAPSTVMTDAEFSAWCARQWSPGTTVDPAESDDRSGWDVDRPFVPSIPEEYEESAFSIGLAGGNCHVWDAFPDSTASERFEGRRRSTGACWRAGSGPPSKSATPCKSCDRPGSVHRRFDREFVKGWEAGSAEWGERQSALAEWAAREQEAEWRDAMEQQIAERELEDRIAAAGGFARYTLTYGDGR